MYTNKNTLEKLTLRTSKNNIDFYCPSVYLADQSNIITFDVYRKSKIIYDPYWDLIKNQFVKYSRYYNSFELYSRDLEAFAIFYSQMSFTSRGVQNIPAFKFDANSTQAKCKQAIDYLTMLAVRLPDIKEISNRVISLHESNQLYNNAVTDDTKEETYTIPESEHTKEKPDYSNCAKLNLYYETKQSANSAISNLKDVCMDRYITIVQSLFNNAIDTDQRDVKVQMLKMAGDTLTSFIKEIDVIADKLYEDVKSCSN